MEAVLQQLHERADPSQLVGMARYGITVENRLGVNIPELRKMAKQIGVDHQLALALWKTGVAEARILASMIANPDQLTEEQMEAWVLDFDSWDVCDQVCMNLFEKSPMVWKKILDWSQREDEFVKRSAYALIACLAWHDKESSDEVFQALVPIIEKGVVDERNYVKKAVSWALRNIGKRSRTLHASVMKTAEKLKASDSKPAKWIASQTVRDLTSEATRRRLEKM